MPNFKKNAMNQIMFPMVDRTDFASIESGITASDFNSAATKKIFGVNHGVSDAFASATISKATTLVRSGIFQQTLKAAECNYDYLIVEFRHPSCADQILIFQPQEIDPSDAYSMLSDFLSDFQSRVPKAVATNSQLSDLHSDLRSFLAVMSGIGSDTYSLLSDMQSDFQSRIPKRVATDSQLSDLHSDLRSFLVVMSGIQSDIYSSLSDIQSDFQSRVPKRVATDSQLSDVHSDLKSAIGGVVATLSVSDISDIASRVDEVLASRLSDILSAAQQGNSRVLVVQSHASDIYSLLSDVQSDFQSRVPKAVATNSQLSDMHSDLRSFLAVMSGIGSDTYSLLSDMQSDFQSRIPKRVATDSQLSDVHSDLKSAIGAITVTISASDVSDIASAVLAGLTTITPSDISDIASAVRAAIVSDLSDILSAAQQGNSRVLVVQSHASNIYSLLSDVQSDLISHLDITGVNLNASVMSDIRSAIAGVVTTLSASDISDIASRVDEVLASRLSDILSAAQQGNSRVLVVQSHASNIYSLLSDVDSNFQSRVPKLVATNSQLSDVHSDLRSQIGGITAGVSASDISDIASAVRAAIVSDLSDILSAAQQGNSRVLVVQSHASNIYSLLSDVQSDLISHLDTTGVNLNASVMSDIRSAIAGVTVTLSASDVSDIASAVAAANTGLTPSDISDIVSAILVGMAGGGSQQCIFTVEDNGNALDGVDVWITTDILGTNFVARGYTNALGQVTFYLDPGSYFSWKQLSGFTFANPEGFTVI